MKKLKIKSELISLEEQIKILERTKAEVYKKRLGLCGIISTVINEASEMGELRNYLYCSYQDVDIFIPLFTKENVLKYGNGIRGVRGVFWWKYRPYDLDSRINFLNWMIEVIKTELENGKS